MLMVNIELYAFTIIEAVSEGNTESIVFLFLLCIIETIDLDACGGDFHAVRTRKTPDKIKYL